MICENKIYDMQYKGKMAVSEGLILYDYAIMSGAGKDYASYIVKGMDGELYGIDERRGPLIISVTLSVLSHNVIQRIREVRRWLDGTGTLSFTDSPDIVYEVQKVLHGAVERDLRKYGRFTVEFRCYPYEFEKSGLQELTKEEIIYNLYDMSKPIYKITGEGRCTLSVNGKSMTAQVGQNLTIDTRLMRAYRKDGTVNNTAVTGEYKDLWLPSGAVSIAITSGFSLAIIPRWGYEL